jgi:hypothetical protein
LIKWCQIVSCVIAIAGYVGPSRHPIAEPESVEAFSAGHAPSHR